MAYWLVKYIRKKVSIFNDLGHLYVK